MKFILVPDSFKGTVSATQICGIMRDALQRHLPGCEVVSFPVADGGEGTVSCFVEAMQGELCSCAVSGPFFDKVDSFYGIITDNGGKKTAVIEMAAAAGLPLAEASVNGKDPLKATTYGVGELMLEAVKNGCEKIILGLGGSATNDGGCGAAAAVGVRFYDANGEQFIPLGGSLSQIDRIDVSEIDPALRNVEIVTMCDVDNPLFGESGAAYIFSPQKGADADTVKVLDQNLIDLDKAIQRSLGLELADRPGAGAAGGMGIGMMAFFSSKLTSGITVVLDTVGFDDAVKGATMVFTGEGRIDGQSVRGKVISGVTQRAKQAGVPVTVIAGDAAEGVEAAYDLGVTAIFSTNRVAKPFSEIKHQSADNLAFAMDNIARMIAATK
ncbi:MAG: glycerate kinase [Oscillospiraceae bacterium]|nr:glycerate kinase [Oscillospiraceae bacterium]